MAAKCSVWFYPKRLLTLFAALGSRGILTGFVEAVGENVFGLCVGPVVGEQCVEVVGLVGEFHEHVGQVRPLFELVAFCSGEASRRFTSKRQNEHDRRVRTTERSGEHVDLWFGCGPAAELDVPVVVNWNTLFAVTDFEAWEQELFPPIFDDFDLERSLDDRWVPY